MSIWKVIAQIWDSVKQVFGALPAELKKIVHVGILVTEQLKILVDSPAADIITALIPGDLDDRGKVWLRNNLPAILVEMHLVDSTLNTTDPEEIAKLAIETLQSVGLTNGDKLVLAARVAAGLSEGKFDWSDAVQLTQFYYNKMYKIQT